MKKQWALFTLLSILCLTFVGGCGKQTATNDVENLAEKVLDAYQDNDTAELSELSSARIQKRYAKNQDAFSAQTLGKVVVTENTAYCQVVKEKKVIYVLNFIFEKEKWRFVGTGPAPAPVPTPAPAPAARS